jgi:hypothetical protein
MTIDRPPCLRISQDAGVINERRWAFIGRAVELNEETLNIKQISLESVEITASLEML